VNASTIVRFAHAAGFRGWPDLQREIRNRYLATLTTEETLVEHQTLHGSAIHNALRNDVQNLTQTLEIISEDEANTAIEMLFEAEQVLALGMGSFGAPALTMAHLGTVMGHNFQCETRGGPALAAQLARLTKDDLLLVCNVWRPVQELVKAMQVAQARQIPVLAITDIRWGEIAANSDQALVVTSEGVSFAQSSTAMTSVIYGLLDGLERRSESAGRTALRGTQEIWNEMATFID
jgi:DNA-binding MurR/RpiR family transcriptional regulator